MENVRSYYEPLIKPQEIQRHYFWCNFHINSDLKFIRDGILITSGKYKREINEEKQIKRLSERYKFNLENYPDIDKKTILRNCVLPELGLHILNESKRDVQPDLFRNIKLVI